MNPENILAGTASLFMALGDKTRLRLLNLMRDREICVSSFTGTLGHSQPLISRHLAYLRNSGIVEARRDGKWMHYSLSKSMDENTSRLLIELFRWMETQEGLRVDRDNYRESYGPAAELIPVEAKPLVLRPRRTSKIKRSVEPSLHIVEHDHEPAIGEPEYRRQEDSAYANQYDPPSHHNELEDFLL